MSNNQKVLTGTVKFYADPAKGKDYGYGPRFNALLVTPQGEQRVYAGVGTDLGNLMAQALGKGSKGKQVSVLVDNNYNFQGLANGQSQAPSNGGQTPQQQQGNSRDDLQGRERVKAYATLMKVCHDEIHKQFKDAGLPIDLEDEILTKYTQTLYISLTR